MAKEEARQSDGLKSQCVKMQGRPTVIIESVDVSAKIEQHGGLTRVLAVSEGSDSTGINIVHVRAILY